MNRTPALVRKPLTRGQWRHIIRKVLAMERSSNDGRPDWRLLRQGFFSARRALYPFDRFAPDLFLSDYELEFRAIGINQPAVNRMLADKLLFHALVRAGGIDARMPRLIGLMLDGQPLRLDGESGFSEALIAKPVDGSGGADVQRVAEMSAVDGDGAYLVEGAVRADPYASTIFPGALNTIRVMTGNDQDGAFVIGAVHRFGTNRSAPVDNFKRGGLSALIDLQTGEMTEAAALPRDGGPQRFSRHPDTDAAIAGAQVPHWADVLQVALRCAALPGLRFAGWDIAVAEDGVVLIEGNGDLPNPNLYQAHRPLLLDPRTRRLFCELEVVTKTHRARLEAQFPA